MTHWPRLLSSHRILFCISPLARSNTFYTKGKELWLECETPIIGSWVWSFDPQLVVLFGKVMGHFRGWRLAGGCVSFGVSLEVLLLLAPAPVWGHRTINKISKRNRKKSHNILSKFILCDVSYSWSYSQPLASWGLWAAGWTCLMTWNGYGICSSGEDTCISIIAIILELCVYRDLFPFK